MIECHTPLFVVNLPRRHDRRQWMELQLQRAGFKATVEFTSDWPIETDGLRLSHATLASSGYQLFDWEQRQSGNMWWNRPLKWGEVGCSIAHIHCWHAIANSPAPFGIIVEDDVVIAPNAHSRFRRALHGLKQDQVAWDLIYLGRFPIGPDTRVTEHLVIPGYSHCTFGYVVTRDAAARMLGTEPLRAIIPADEFLPAMYVEHPRADVRKRFPPMLRAVAFDPPLITQLPKDDAGSDTEATAFV